MSPRETPRRTADEPSDRAVRLRDWVRPRARIVGGAAALGVVAGAAAMAALTLSSGDPGGSEATAFALGALALGFGVLGWSGSVIAGRSVEAMHRRLDTGSDWTERDSRRAMARIAGFGTGVVVGVSVLAATL
ncbi:DUF7268 family protein [Halosimplex salinum]|uniref:DUF7268 family protein n=1 Tax=Halosimplex salinum TaxID=1710538 RepID=UPI0019D11B88|nr:hypothetical protein [Halosimplex salinum]